MLVECQITKDVQETIAVINDSFELHTNDHIVVNFNEMNTNDLFNLDRVIYRRELKKKKRKKSSFAE